MEIRKRQLELREKLREISEKFRGTEQQLRSNLSTERYSQVEGLMRLLEQHSEILNQIMKNEEESLLEP